MEPIQIFILLVGIICIVGGLYLDTWHKRCKAIADEFIPSMIQCADMWVDRDEEAFIHFGTSLEDAAKKYLKETEDGRKRCLNQAKLYRNKIPKRLWNYYNVPEIPEM